ncbi:hypothetical protein D3C87_1827630 [compost metagenome]
MDDLADFGDREADAATAKDFLKQPAVRSAVKTRAATALWMKQALILVEAQGARRDAEFTGQFRYAIMLLHVGSNSSGTDIILTIT